jgi:glucose-1-phosphate cytidylyltransferase
MLRTGRNEVGPAWLAGLTSFHLALQSWSLAYRINLEQEKERSWMRVVILAGGLGTRLQEETTVKPKPMVEIGGRPILWHIMKIYAAFGYKEFVIALGYKGEVIKNYFLNYYQQRNSITVQLDNGSVEVHDEGHEDWNVHLIDTGFQTQTGGRIKRLAPWVRNGTFMLTYGDGVANIDIGKLVAFHRRHGKLATVTAVRPPARFGGLNFKGNLVTEFVEKPQIGEGWINGGFFVLEPGVLEYIEGNPTAFEREPLERLAQEEQLVAYRHDEFWQSMDTLRDVRLLESLWESGHRPWGVEK